VAPIVGAGQARAARNAGFKKAEGLHSLRLEGPDKAGLANRIAALLAGAGINLRGFSGAALGRKAVFYFAFDTPEETRKAGQALKKEFGG
jgi:UTP:GlnB (protein PII) uridylyltransferase